MKISPGQELVFSEIMKKTAQALILESTLEREDTMMTTHEGIVEFQIEMETIFFGGFDLRLRKIWLLNVAV